jgi:hypothetical protein
MHASHTATVLFERARSGGGGAWDGGGDQRRLHLEGELEDLVEADGRRAGGQGPLEGLHEAGDPKADGDEAEVLAGANAAAGAERREAEVPAADVHVCAALRRQEAPWREGLRVGPHGRVVGDGPHVHHRRGAGRDHHAVGEDHVGGGQARPAQQRTRRVKAQGLLDDGLQVRHARHVGVGDVAARDHRGVHLVAEAGLHGRVAHQLRHAPLGQKRGRVGATENHLL